MADNKRDLSEELFVAIETIANKSLEGLKYDRTILCTITDASNADAGEYTVSDGSVEFIAYSNDKYGENANVYVTIPQGDYNQRKYIIGKYQKEDDKPYNYVSPTANYVEIINLNNEMNQVNPTTNKIQNAGSLLANKENRKVIKIFEKTNITDLDGYDMLGIKADFRTVLSDFNTISGNYGLILELVCKENYDTDYIRQLEEDLSGPNAGEDPKPLSSRLNDNASIEPLQTIEKDSVLNTYLLYFDSNEMFGNPYNFVANMSQEKAFNISDYKGIESLTLYLYQQNNFKDINNNNIPYQFESIAGNEDLPDNIFVDNIEISFGYNLSNFEDKDNILLLYSLDKKSYSQVLNGKKTIQLKWVRKIDDTIKVAVNINNVRNVFNLSSDKCKIVWYRWNLSPDVADPLAGAFWEKCADAENKFSYQFTPNLNSQYERFKVGVIIYGDKIDQEENNEELANENYIIEEYFESEVVEFYNEQEIPNSATLDLIYGLTLTTSDTLGGVYIIYLPNGTLMNESQKNTQRYITASYSSLFTGVTGLDGTETVTWKVPAHNTMIKIDTGTNDLIGGKRWKEKDGYWVIENAAISTEEEVEVAIGDSHERKSILPFKIAETYSPQLTNNTIECIIHKNGLNYKASLPMSFGISGTNGTDYTLVFEISDPDAKALVAYKRKINEDDPAETDNPRIWDSSENRYRDATQAELNDPNIQGNIFYYRHILRIRAQLRDYDGNVLAPTNGITFGWFFNSLSTENDKLFADVQCKSSGDLKDDNFYHSYVSGKIPYKDKQGNVVTVSNGTYNTTPIIALYPRVLIAKATAKYNGQTLTAYLPIPVARFQDQKDYIFEGPTKIYYDGNGQNPTYTRIPYKLWDGNNQILTDNQKLLSWKLGIYNKNNCRDYITTNGSKQARDEDNKGDGYPYLDNDNNSLVCPQIYFNNLYTNKMPCMCIYGNYKDSGGERLLWIQPILVLLNRFGSSMLNKWDGSLTIDEENNQILTSVIAAGKKEDDNSYSGVVLGEIAKASNVKDKTGLLGYNQGKQTFLLSADDGHLELGESGAGQIIMQGKTGTIKSGNYSSTDGMKIDLQNGQIDAYNFKLTSNNVTIDSSTASKAYFVVKTNNENPKDLIKMSDTAYFLQSANYIAASSTTTGDGMKINLNDGQIDAYNFKLSSRYIVLDSRADSTTHLKIFGNSTNTPLIYSTNEEVYQRSDDSSFYIRLTDYNTGQSGLWAQEKKLYYNETKGTTTTNVYVVRIANKDPYFRISAGVPKITNPNNISADYYTDSDGNLIPKVIEQKNLMYIGLDTNYLQSSNFKSGSEGMKIDLNDGQIDAYNFKLKSKNVTIDSTENATNYFTVKGYKDIVEVDANWEPKLDENGNENIERKNETATLMNVSRDSIDIQAADQESFKLHLTSKRRKKTYSDGSYSIKYDNSYLSGKVPFYLYDKDSATGSTKYYETIKIQNIDDPYLQINGISASLEQIGNTYYYTSVTSTPLLTVGKNKYELQSANYVKATSNAPGDGMKINLNDGQIDAYNFKLTSKHVIINSSTSTEDKFAVYGQYENGKTTRPDSLMRIDNSKIILKSNDKIGISQDLISSITSAFKIQVADYANDYTSGIFGRGYFWWYDTEESDSNKKLKLKEELVLRISNKDPLFQIKTLYPTSMTQYEHWSKNFDGTWKLDKEGNHILDYFPTAYTTKDILKISTTEQYLQSANYSNTDGMKIDLTKGSITAYNFKLTSNRVIIDSSGGTNTTKSYFKIKSNNTNISLINVSENETLLQSANKSFQIYFNGNTESNTSSYVQGLQSKIYWSTASQTTKIYNFTAVYLANSDPYFFVRTFDPLRETTVVNGISEPVPIGAGYKSLLHFSSTQHFIQSANFDSNSKTGMLLNLKTGKFTGYNARLDFSHNRIVTYLCDYKKDTSGNYVLKDGKKIEIWKKEIIRSSTSRVYGKDKNGNDIYKFWWYDISLPDPSIEGPGKNINPATGVEEGKDVIWCWEDDAFKDENIKEDSKIRKKEVTNQLILSSETNSNNPIYINNGTFRVTWGGYLTAQAGTIGGWNIFKDYLCSSGRTVGMAKWKSTTHPVFWSGYDAYNKPDWKTKVGFGVSGAGELFANKGQVGGWNLNNTKLFAQNLSGVYIKDKNYEYDTNNSQWYRYYESSNGTYYRHDDDSENKVTYNKIKNDGPKYSREVVPSAVELNSNGEITAKKITANNGFYGNLYGWASVAGSSKTADYSNKAGDLDSNNWSFYMVGNQLYLKIGNTIRGGFTIGGGSGGGGSSSCFIAGTQILMEDYTYKNIEDIKSGDIIICYNEQTNTFCKKPVLRTYKYKRDKQILLITFSNNIQLGVTFCHPLLSTTGWKSRNLQLSFKYHKIETSWLNINDQILSYYGPLNIKNIEILQKDNNDKFETYNLNIKDCHTFLANTIIVHNSEEKGQ